MKFIQSILLTMILSFGLHADWKSAGGALTAFDGGDGDQFGYSVDAGNTYAAVGSPSDGEGSVYIFKKDENGIWQQMQKLENPQVVEEEVDGDWKVMVISSFGASIAISNEIISGHPPLIVIGAPDSSIEHWVMENMNIPVPIKTSTSYTGAICTYEFNAVTEVWEQHEDCNFGNATGDHIYGHSVAITSWVESKFVLEEGVVITPYSRFIVGDPGDDTVVSNAGSVSIYGFNSTTHRWSLIDEVDSPAAITDNQFGSSVAIYEETALVGAPGYDSASKDQIGKIYFYDTSDASLISSHDKPENCGTESPNVHFGTSVDINAQYAIVGAEHECGAEDAGVAYIYKDIAYINKDNGIWEYSRKLYGSTVMEAADGYGKSVSITPYHAVVGAPSRTSDLLIQTGAVFLYDNNGKEVWTENAFYYGSEDSLLGHSVSLYRHNAFVGVPNDEKVNRYEYFVPDTSSMNPAIIMYLLN